MTKTAEKENGKSWNSAWKYIVWLLTLAALGGGIATTVKISTVTLEKHEARIAECEKTGVILETKVERIVEDVAWLRRRFEREDRHP